MELRITNVENERTNPFSGITVKLSPEAAKMHDRIHWLSESFEAEPAVLGSPEMKEWSDLREDFQGRWPTWYNLLLD